jgi:DnaJ-class molecular chaperone
MNPFLVLNVPITATDADIRRAYLAAVQECPPEKDAARFQSVQEAWRQIGEARTRWESVLFPEPPPAGQDSLMEAARQYSRLPGKLKPVPAPVLRAWFTHCASK